MPPKSPSLVSMTLPGDPVSKARARYSARLGGRMYTPTPTKDAQRVLGTAIMANHPGLAIDALSSFRVSLAFFTRSRQRRDIDNMVKMAMDACTGLVWKDDSQVEELHARLVRADENPRTELTIDVLSEGAHAVQKYISCERCGKAVRIYPSWANRKYCSRTCSALAQGTKVEIECANCGKVVARTPSSLSEVGLPYCSMRCKSLHGSRELRCRQCGSAFRKPTNTANKGIPLCSDQCRRVYWPAHRKAAAAGTCIDCGGPTTKKSYLRCYVCRPNAAHQRALLRAATA